MIPSNRLFFGSDPVGDSPYTVTVLPHKPSQPQAVSLAVEAWDEVRVSFMPPENDGGEGIEGYMVEWWPATVSDGYGSPEVQTLKIGGDVDGELMSLKYLGNTWYIAFFPAYHIFAGACCIYRFVKLLSGSCVPSSLAGILMGRS